MVSCACQLERAVLQCWLPCRAEPLHSSDGLRTPNAKGDYVSAQKSSSQCMAEKTLTGRSRLTKGALSELPANRSALSLAAPRALVKRLASFTRHVAVLSQCNIRARTANLPLRIEVPVKPDESALQTHLREFSQDVPVSRDSVCMRVIGAGQLTAHAAVDV